MRSQPFEQVVDQYGPMVFRVCRAVVGQHDADDAWSETFLSALRAYPDLDEDTNVEAWLITIAHRKAIDVVRGNARRPRPVENLPDRPGGDGRPGDRDLDLWSSVATLPDKQRLAVAYHHLAGLPYAQVAQLVGGSADAARRAAADGIKNLRAGYRDAADEGARA